MHIYYMISIKMARNELLFDRFRVEEKFHMKINLFEIIGIWNIRNIVFDIMVMILVKVEIFNCVPCVYCL